jgi:hypothetical protein
LYEKTLEALHLLYEIWEVSIDYSLEHFLSEERHLQQVEVFYIEWLLITILLWLIIYPKWKKIIDFHKENEFSDIIKEYWFIIKDYWYIALPIILNINSSIGII